MMYAIRPYNYCKSQIACPFSNTAKTTFDVGKTMSDVEKIMSDIIQTTSELFSATCNTLENISLQEVPFVNYSF